MVSKRLKSISSLINYGEDIIDIGCDHGLLDIYLTLECGCHCSCCDVNSNIVNRAISNIKKYNLLDSINVFVGNGFDDLGLSYNQVMVMSGMGTSTILRILEKNKTHDIICQTNTDLYSLRKGICEMGYCISSEDIVFDNGRYYISVRFSIGSSNYTYDELLLGPCLIKSDSKIFHDYINNLYKKIIGGYNKSILFESNNSELELMVNCLKKYIKSQS
jgi:tRNA (adenine22-N1)-methyltransferase